MAEQPLQRTDLAFSEARAVHGYEHSPAPHFVRVRVREHGWQLVKEAIGAAVSTDLDPASWTIAPAMACPSGAQGMMGTGARSQTRQVKRRVDKCS